MQKINTISFNRKDLSIIGCSYDSAIEDCGDYQDEVAKLFFEKMRTVENGRRLPNETHNHLCNINCDCLDSSKD